jgi:probable HAF family extracellular repeat protein
MIDYHPLELVITQSPIKENLSLMSFHVRIVVGLIIALSTFVAVPCGHAQVFSPPKTYPSGGTKPLGLATGDFNGDGKMDIAVVNQDNTVGVRLGEGNGEFGPMRVYSVNEGTFLTSIAVGDFNEDGKLDLVVGVANVNTGVALLRGKGDGTFESPSYLNGPSPISMAVADLNHDGHLDLFLGGNGGSDVLLGNGDGSFRAPIPISTGGIGTAIAVATGDFNNDGNPDLVAANFTDNTVGVLLGNGDGTFQPVRDYPVGLGGCCSYPNALALGDFNRDGKLDIAVGDFGDNGLNILLGNGDGTFQPAVVYLGGMGVGSLQAADLNGDGILDLVATSFNGDGVTINLGNGDGTFNFGPDFVTGLSPTSVIVADFHRHGIPDMAVTNSVSNEVAILLNQKGQRGFYKVTDIGSLEGPAGGSTASDINDQGVVAATSYPPTTGAVAFVWEDGRRIPLPTLGGHYSSALALNKSQVVGQSNLPGDTIGHATLWNASRVTDLGTLGGDTSIAWGINTQQQVVGRAETGSTTGASGSPVGHAFLEDLNSSMQDLGTLGGDNSIAFAINHHGTIVGQADISTTPDPNFFVPPFHAFIWQRGAMQDLGSIFGGTFSLAQDINEKGQVVGSADTANDQEAHAFLWENGSVTDLGALTANTANQPAGINNEGVVVGSSGFSGASFSFGPPVNQYFCPCHTVLWKDGRVIDLQTQLPGDSPWILLTVSAINDHGQIVGQGLVHNQVHGFLLTPRDETCDDSDNESPAKETLQTARPQRVIGVVRNEKALRLKMQDK